MPVVLVVEPLVLPEVEPDRRIFPLRRLRLEPVVVPWLLPEVVLPEVVLPEVPMLPEVLMLPEPEVVPMLPEVEPLVLPIVVVPVELVVELLVV